MLTHEELTEIVEPLRMLTDLQVYQKLDELKLPPSTRDHVLRALKRRRQRDLIDRAVSDNMGLTIGVGATREDMLNAMAGIAKEAK